MSFEPIAIVGRGALFPDALNPGELWDLVSANRDAVSACPDGRWRVPKIEVLGEGPDKAWTDRGGYVAGFDGVFDPEGFAISPLEIETYDETLRWLLYTAREALYEAGIWAPRPRMGAVVGLLGLPSESMAQYAEQIWRNETDSIVPRVSSSNRFVSGLPVHLLAKALQLDLGAFALDAACASSIYAIKLACDQLHDRHADVMLAGGVNRADDLFLHIGFSTLKAISRGGRSRPFHSEADGLLPAEGAGFVVLKRLVDAETERDRILAVIRGIGISNDGRSAGLLTPSEAGQEDAMRQAYMMANLDPVSISLIECHATGTLVGDACEIRSMARVFGGGPDMPIGSIKSNLGHPITAAGIAGLLKIIGAMEHQVRPATLHVTASDAIVTSPFRLLFRNEPWHATAPRRAALNAFGFGGNNAHLILEEYSGPIDAVPSESPRARIAIVSVGVTAGDASGRTEFTRAVFRNQARNTRAEEVSLDLQELGFPPLDLAAALPQQVLALQAATEALEGVSVEGRVGVFTGMGCDVEVARYGLRWRSQSSEPDSICPPLTAPAVLGRLANITANRISNKFNFRGPSFAVMSEEISGIVAVRLAARALAAGEIDVAIAGAVDLSCEPVHESATQKKPGDAAIFFVLKRRGETGEKILATLEGEDALPFANSALFGHAHAAEGMLQAAIALLCCTHAALPSGEPWISSSSRSATVKADALGGQSASFTVSAAPESVPQSLLLEPAPRIYVYSGTDRQDLIESVQLDRRMATGMAKLTIVAGDEAELARKGSQAIAALKAGADVLWTEGTYYRAVPIRGELAFVFGSAAASYKGMGRSLLLAFPELLDHLRGVCPSLLSAACGMFQPSEPKAAEKLWGSSLLCQAHAHFSLNVLGLRPSAAIGVSSGETNSLAAFGVWRDLDRFYKEFTDAHVLDRNLGGVCEVTDGVCWGAWQVAATRTEIELLLQQNPALRLTGCFAPDEFTVAGEVQACANAVAHFGVRAQRLNYDLVIHCPDFQPYSETWRRLHWRQSFPCPAVRFYSHATNAHYVVTKDSIADALTQQALQPLDFPALVKRAWDDGIRIFLEHGPQGVGSSRIRKILGDREHIAIPMDLASADSLRQSIHAVAQLISAGVEVPNSAVFDLLEPRPRSPGHMKMTLPLHAPPVVVTAKPQGLNPRIPLDSSVAPPVSIFDGHVRALSQGYTRFLKATGIGPFDDFLGLSIRAFEKATGTVSAASVENPIRWKSSTKADRVQFDREQLIWLSSQNVGDILGPEFREVDAYRRIVRLPMPPLLLVDRVTDLKAKALSLGTGSIETETDVAANSWYMFRGRMPAGIMIESGQADLLLISWLGIDRHSKGHRVYRLLGCELTWHGGLPKPGDTLHYDIRIDQHARQGDIHLFFFHYDCFIEGEVRLSVRNGQAGFFTDRELADSAGVLSAPEAPTNLAGCERLFTRNQIEEAAAGNAYSCFGEGLELAATHQRSPGFSSPDLLLLDSVTHLSSDYLRAEMNVVSDAWFFKGHFKDDPCMPGTLMFEGCLQAMAFFMMSQGMTTEKDGWRFEPVPEVAYPLQCRGQVIPTSKKLVYELFVKQDNSETSFQGDDATVYADLLCTVDGLKAFYCRRMGLRLTHGFPLDEEGRQIRIPLSDTVAASVNGVTLDYSALLACAWGSPVNAFGPPLERFAKAGRLPRLPGPPYHFMTRITRLEGEFGVERSGSSVTAEFDLEPSEWYFQRSGSGLLPLAVLMEIALQPCGWLGSFIGIPLRSKDDLYFRNLDGQATAGPVIAPASGVLRTQATLTNVARSGGIILTNFDVECDLNGEIVFRMQTGFGFFRGESLKRQAGLGPAPQPSAQTVVINLNAGPQRYFAGPLRMPSPDLLMLDRVTGIETRTQGTGTGWVRAEKDVRPDQWFFKAHFYQDPVQPGSLGLEAMVQALQFYVIHARLADGTADPAFMLYGPLAWKYRGQVVPTNRLVTVDVHIKSTERGSGSLSIRAEGWLSVDGLRIYHLSDFGLRVVSRTA